MRGLKLRELASFLVLIVWVGLVQAEDIREVVVESAKELKGICAKKIAWKKDGAKMILVLGEYEEKKTYDCLGKAITKRVKVEGCLGDYWEVVYKYSRMDKHPMIYVS